MADAATFQVDAAAVAAAVTERTKAVVINSPNNPVGSVYSRENLSALADVLHEAQDRLGTTIYLVADEPYREITYGAEVPWVPGVYDRTIVCYSYSKSLSLPGERIGWVLVPPTNPEHDDLVLAVAGAGRKLGFVCAPALFQRVLMDCVDEPSDVEAYAENRRALTEGLSKLGYEFIEPEARSTSGSRPSSLTPRRSSSVPRPSSSCPCRPTPSAAPAGCAWATASPTTRSCAPCPPGQSSPSPTHDKGTVPLSCYAGEVTDAPEPL